MYLRLPTSLARSLADTLADRTTRGTRQTLAGEKMLHRRPRSALLINE